MGCRSPRKSQILGEEFLEKRFRLQLQIPHQLPFSRLEPALPEIPEIHLHGRQSPLGRKKRVGITINFRRIKTEKSRSRNKAGCAASNIDKVYDFAIFLPGPGRESHPTSDL